MLPLWSQPLSSVCSITEQSSGCSLCGQIYFPPPQQSERSVKIQVREHQDSAQILHWFLVPLRGKAKSSHCYYKVDASCPLLAPHVNVYSAPFQHSPAFPTADGRQIASSNSQNGFGLECSSLECPHSSNLYPDTFFSLSLHDTHPCPLSSLFLSFSLWYSHYLIYNIFYEFSLYLHINNFSYLLSILSIRP